MLFPPDQCIVSNFSTPPNPPISPTKNPIPRHPHRTPQQDRHRRVHPEPRAAHKRRARNGHQPRVRPERTPALHHRRQIPNLPKLVHSREDEPHGRRIDASQDGQEPRFVPQDAPQAHEAHHDEEPGRVHCDEGDHSADIRRYGGSDDGEGAQVDREVEVGAGEGLDDREAEEEVARGHPARGDDVFAKEGDDDRAAAKDDRAGEVEGGEEGEGLGCVAEDDVEGDG